MQSRDPRGGGRGAPFYSQSVESDFWGRGLLFTPGRAHSISKRRFAPRRAVVPAGREQKAFQQEGGSGGGIWLAEGAALGTESDIRGVGAWSALPSFLTGKIVHGGHFHQVPPHDAQPLAASDDL